MLLKGSYSLVEVRKRRENLFPNENCFELSSFERRWIAENVGSTYRGLVKKVLSICWYPLSVVFNFELDLSFPEWKLWWNTIPCWFITFEASLLQSRSTICVISLKSFSFPLWSLFTTYCTSLIIYSRPKLLCLSLENFIDWAHQ